MKYYRLEPSVKKSVIEWHTFKRKDADGNTIFLRKELGWRYGAWLISVPETDEEIKEYLSDKGEYESFQEYLADYYGEDDIITEETKLEDYLLPKIDEDFIDISEDYEDAEMLETWDGCWEDWSLVGAELHEIDEEQQEQWIEDATAAYDEDYEDGVEDLGWEFIDCFYEMHCHPEITPCDKNGNT